MKLHIEELSLKNFKGVKELKLTLNDSVNEIHGRNGVGKTTISDAFNWLLFDKDSKERSKFEIKPLDFMNNVLSGLEPTVSAVLSVDGKKLQLKKIYREKWEKPRGQSERVFTGNTTNYYINELKVKKSDYAKQVADLLDEKVFKLLTNPRRFSELKWDEQRNILMALIGGYSDDMVFDSDGKLLKLKKLIGESDVEKFYKLTTQNIKNLNDEIKKIPVRIDEANNSMVDDDFESIEVELAKLKDDLKVIDSQIADASKVSDSDVRKQASINDAKLRLNEMKTTYTDGVHKEKGELTAELSTAKINLAVKEKELEANKKAKDDCVKEITNMSNHQDALRKEWHAESEKKFSFDEELDVCPTCKRAYSELDKTEIINLAHGHFNMKKTEKLSEIQREGTNLAAGIKVIEEKIAKLAQKIKMNEKEIKFFVSQVGRFEDAIGKYGSLDEMVEEHFKDDKVYHRYKQLAESDFEIKPLDQLEGGLQIAKQDLEIKIENLQERYSFKAINDKTSKRIETLKADERKHAEKIAELEGHQYLCEEFTRKKVNLLDSRINEKFDLVKFKMFNEQVNGALVSTCEAMVAGVPYSNANNAAQINAGLDIIKALQEFYDFKAPIFVDNRESVNEIIPMESQIINLSVSDSESIVVA